MKQQLLIAMALFAAGSYAEEAAQVKQPATTTAEVKEPEKATVEESGKDHWPSLNEWAQNNQLMSGTLSASILLGYEYNDQGGNTTKAANALLTRTRVTYATDNEEGFNTLLEAQYVGPLNNHYNPRNPNYDTVMDPEAFRFQQAYLAYTAYDTTAKVGVQEILLDNQRFIGNVGWRFNGQSFNAFLAKNNSIENLTLLYAYAGSINAIDGNNYKQRQYNLLNAAYKLNDSNQVSGFAYLQENDNSDDVNTFGIRGWGKNETLAYDAMGAIQSKAYYGYLTGALESEPGSIELGFEYLSGGDNTREQFKTLNGTAHKFNGWADEFDTNNGLLSGLVDIWVKGTLSPMDRMDLIAAFHYFNTAANTPSTAFSGNYGNEIDAMVEYQVCKNFNALAGVAIYIQGDDAASNPTDDDNVFWLRGNFTF